MASRKDGASFPCGQCLNCRINKRRLWLARLLLEACSHEFSAFVTLTFRDVGTPQPVRRSDVSQFIRRLRRIVGCEVRYFAAAEYGTLRGRGHYHIHCFGDRPFGRKNFTEAWPYGSIHVGDCESASFEYTLGYVLKGNKEPRWGIEHRYPEFRSFSKGIGGAAFDHLCLQGEVVREFKLLGQLWPVHRYFRSLAKAKNVGIKLRKEEASEKLEAETMRRLLADPSLSPEQVSTLYDEYLSRRKALAVKRKEKAIRDAYRELHGHSLKRGPNETF